MRSVIATTAALLSGASAAFQGFNYGATKSGEHGFLTAILSLYILKALDAKLNKHSANSVIDGSFMYQADYEAKFRNAKGLAGTNGAFTSARLYTTIVIDDLGLHHERY
jgi:glucan endo-1,3-beta-D-glucosidase